MIIIIAIPDGKVPPFPPPPPSHPIPWTVEKKTWRVHLACFLFVQNVFFTLTLGCI